MAAPALPPPQRFTTIKVQVTRVLGVLRKVKISLPCSREHYNKQIRALICFCKSDYTAGWTDVEGTTVKGIPVRALLGEIKLQN